MSLVGTFVLGTGFLAIFVIVGGAVGATLGRWDERWTGALALVAGLTAATLGMWAASQEPPADEPYIEEPLR